MGLSQQDACGISGLVKTLYFLSFMPYRDQGEYLNEQQKPQTFRVLQGLPERPINYGQIKNSLLLCVGKNNISCYHPWAP
jgi:hypothetical protein